jgi:hypothetical protein
MSPSHYLRDQSVIYADVWKLIYNDCVNYGLHSRPICAKDAAYTVLLSRNRSTTSSSSGDIRCLPRPAAANGIAARSRSAGGPAGRAAGSIAVSSRANSRSVNARRTAGGHSSTTSPRCARVIDKNEIRFLEHGLR